MKQTLILPLGCDSLLKPYNVRIVGLINTIDALAYFIDNIKHFENGFDRNKVNVYVGCEKHNVYVFGQMKGGIKYIYISDWKDAQAIRDSLETPLPKAK